VAGLDSKYRDHLETLAGGELRGLCIASRQKGMFKGGAVAIGVTDPGGEWFNVDAVVLDHAAVRLEIRTTDGEKLKLMLMRGEGRVFGGLGGGESQRQGLEALAAWFRTIDG
jgi:hypothetical protein